MVHWERADESDESDEDASNPQLMSQLLVVRAELRAGAAALGGQLGYQIERLDNRLARIERGAQLSPATTQPAQDGTTPREDTVPHSELDSSSVTTSVYPCSVHHS
mmetsp:Transcript_17675/g.45197  ORF Transcript_17675/g.45197 Transcript_17675/m.45197 type:complete len:106 (+) Transcript_17675:49-366(+)